MCSTLATAAATVRATACVALCAFAAPSRAVELALDEELQRDVATLLEREARLPLGTAMTLPLSLEQTRSLVAATPHGRSFGVGLQVGAPTALTLKYMLQQGQSIVVGVGASFGLRGGFGLGLSIHADYLFDVAQLVKNETLALTAYLGPGAWLALFNGGYGLGYGYYYAPGWGYFGVGARLPLGLSLAFQAAPIEVYLELDPALFIFPGIDFGIGASLGFRFYL